MACLTVPTDVVESLNSNVALAPVCNRISTVMPGEDDADATVTPSLASPAAWEGGYDTAMTAERLRRRRARPVACC